ncbi:hypothetical protein CYLTODRAFT_399460 [Cylindrobasidium torrendii FP15055 ss-10]|uniref:DUF6533 domain-containing protein n=1 Tax=Cylindrobasidium torrendii FP15055 ss-10 TaxID=1314674 RepID=A0A0D7B8Z8_9AGAR|nr:hypothetical protein CYLTODRAFT_399460 [Cylindrobasidium torrendii FP15055 ss-10]
MASEVDYYDLRVAQYLNLVAFVVLYYDWIITLGQEISRMWTIDNVSFSVVGYYLNRYVCLLGHIPVVLQFFVNMEPGEQKTKLCVSTICSLKTINLRYRRCHTLQLYHQLYAIAIQVIVSTVLIIRTYALYGRSRRIAAFQITVALVALGVGIYALFSGRSKGAPVPDLPLYVGCTSGVAKDTAERIGAAWSSMLVFDGVIFYLTVHKAIELNKQRGVNLLRILLRDGAVYFAVMIIANVANIITFFVGRPYFRGAITTFMNVISSTMVSRLILNLRDPKLSSSAGRHWMSTSIADYPIMTTLDPQYTSMQPTSRVFTQGERETGFLGVLAEDEEDDNISLCIEGDIELRERNAYKVT